ncbi:MAG: gamma-glutamyltransferase [Rhodocyclaceae bacterium]|jgi:gamma-glutamyltranspeptidase/glutathione hydrolase|nr:gamma-glutamyltransferase [Rhodocyclaceae bacterium]MCA3077031.1 gamma-glutamyltransferase [Rhodocyclaceae bacterium]MCA3090175.1 gamma-glutamyltransferase [Rhodocyclaceae bacterium]MCA3093821.1 gamma-glutamyltransferase [Rhodocyclaceae bacterium]MCA3098814.1 gamma-glutamyltransferase [Rhodocyclaceae bacterium]
MAQKRERKLAVGAISARPTLTGNHHAVATGHYLASLAAMRVLDRGGNAIDAGVTASMALAVLQCDMVSFAGVAPTLIYLKEEGRVVSLAGLGYWPAATDVGKLIAAGNGKHVPEGLLRTVIPAAPGTHIEALRRWGTITFEEAATPAMELARDGFAVFPLLASNLEYVYEQNARWPDNHKVFNAPGDRALRHNEVIRQTDLAKSIGGMIEAERHARGDRDRKLRAARDFFYDGPIADAIEKYHVENGGFMRRSDMAAWEVPVEDSLRVDYRGYQVHSCDAWCQGIVLLESLKILDGYDLRAIGHNSPDYVHTVAGALNLAFADREAYVSDPKFVPVPSATMLSDAYAALQRARIDPAHAFPKMPDPGPVGEFALAGSPGPKDPVTRSPAQMSMDTIYGCTVDRHGNAYSATLSDPQYDTPIIPGTGLAISGRGCQSRLEPGHAAEVRPGKRPRLTPNPSLAFRDGELFMAFGTPGGDVQSQGMLQVFLNVVEFGMTMQQAVEAPRFASYNFPNSFAPHEYRPGRLGLETDLSPEVFEAMRSRGHDVETWPRWSAVTAAVCAIMRHESGQLHAGADPRREGYALAW